MTDLEHRKEVTSLVSKMEKAKRRDLDYLRSFLLEEPERGSTRSADESLHYSKQVRPRRDHSHASAKWKLRCILLDFPLMLLFASLAVVHTMRFVWTEYYVPLMERARRTDDDLLQEYTYYERMCSVEDVTKGFKKGTPNTTTKEALDTLLLHGATVIPDLLQPQTISELRRYLKKKNHRISEEEAYPMSQGYQRLSYGLEPTEDDAVVQALREITSHRLLPQLLEELLGVEDPALSELTTITSFYGAEDQVIHSDTKSDGYAGQFARTYAHTYSLFIPMQPITTQMGVTQLCPGTHFCTNDMQDVCEEEMFGINEAYEDEVWKAGDGALLNQQVWHGGSRHNDQQAPERIIFILSFVARPQLGLDPRQLARGTYFHMKWNMWGHTFSDISKDSSQSTAFPFNVLRSLALWKPRLRNWGYDLLLSAALRATNGQSGMEVEDLETFIELKMNGLFHFPKWLQGSFSHDDDDNPWQTYLQETLDNTYVFLQAVNAAFLGLYVMLSTVVTFVARGGATQPFRLRGVLRRLIFTHGAIAACAWSSERNVRLSEFDMMRPFPTDSDFTSLRWEHDPTIPQGPTTLPERLDILFGSRLDAPWLGSYNRWLDYHPGNRIFETEIRKRAYLYPMYNDLEKDPVFLRNLVNDIISDVVAEETRGGRFLQQDHLSGDWVSLSIPDAMELVRASLAIESKEILKKVDSQIRFLVADYRFGRLRGTALALESTLYLFVIRKQLLRSHRPLLQSQRHPSPTRLGPPNNKPKSFKPQPCAMNLKPISTVSDVLDHPDSTTEPVHQLAVGSPVMVFRSLDKTWARGSVRSVTGDTFAFDITYTEDGSFEENVSVRRLRRIVHLEEGTRVRVYLENGEVIFGVISMVFASGFVDIVLGGGETIQNVHNDFFDIQYPTLW